MNAKSDIIKWIVCNFWNTLRKQELSMRQLYNQSALDKISSQNRLDKMIRIVPPSAWVSIIGAAVIIICLFVWGFNGSIPTKENAKGVYMNEEGLYGQYSGTSGILIDLNVKAGDTVEEGTPIGTIASDEYFKLSQLDERIAYVENITFESDFDTVTQDTKELAEIKREANKPDAEAEAIETNLNIKKQRLASVQKEAETKKAEMLAYKQTYYATLALDDPTAELKYNEKSQDFETSRSVFESAKNAYLSAEEEYYQQKKDFNARYKHFDYDNASEEEQAAYDAAKADLKALADEAEDYNILMEDAEDEYDNANNNLDAARSDYLGKLSEAATIRIENSIAYNEYSELLNAYNTLLSEYKALSEEISELEVQLVVSRFNELADYDSYSQQFDNQKAAVLSLLANERSTCINEIQKETIEANVTGTIYRIDAEVGAGIAKGEKVVTIFPKDGWEESCVNSYVPYDKVAEIEVGQEVHINPTGMNPNEYGYIYGHVTHINDYVESEQSMMEKINSEDLIRQFTAEGAVTEVRIALEEDPDSKSGYRWSNERGDEKGIKIGDKIEAVFITDTKRPVDVLIPYVKDKLEFKEKKDDTV